MDTEEALRELVGLSIIDTYQGDSGVQITLNDGRVLIILGLGIMLPGEHVLQ